MRWVFEMFMGVIQSVVVDVDLGRTIKVIVNLNDAQTIILRLLGKKAKIITG